MNAGGQGSKVTHRPSFIFFLSFLFTPFLFVLGDFQDFQDLEDIVESWCVLSFHSFFESQSAR
jgi:ABC-type polysaccharide transport system permease subunit